MGKGNFPKKVSLVILGTLVFRSHGKRGIAFRSRILIAKAKKRQITSYTQGNGSRIVIGSAVCGLQVSSENELVLGERGRCR